MRAAQTFQPSGPRTASRTASSTVCVTGPGRAARLPPLPAFQRGAPQLYGTATPGPCAAGHQERAWPRLLRWPRGTLGPHPEATRLCAEAPTSPARSALSSPSNPAQAARSAGLSCSICAARSGRARMHSCLADRKLRDCSPRRRPRSQRGWRHARALCAL